jgi:hypothetical protein
MCLFRLHLRAISRRMESFGDFCLNFGGVLVVDLLHRSSISGICQHRSSLLSRIHFHDHCHGSHCGIRLPRCEFLNPYSPIKTSTDPQRSRPGIIRWSKWLLSSGMTSLIWTEMSRQARTLSARIMLERNSLRTQRLIRTPPAPSWQSTNSGGRSRT